MDEEQMEQQPIENLEEPAPSAAPAQESEPTVLLAELEAARSEVAAHQRRAEEAEAQALAAYRRALLAEHRGHVIEELIQGESVEALEASLETAQAAYQRVADQAAQTIAAAQVPVGAPARLGEAPESLSPLDKIVRGLRR